MTQYHFGMDSSEVPLIAEPRNSFQDAIVESLHLGGIPAGTKRMKPALKIEAWGTTTCTDLSSTEFAVKKSVL